MRYRGDRKRSWFDASLSDTTKKKRKRIAPATARARLCRKRVNIVVFSRFEERLKNSENVLRGKWSTRSILFYRGVLYGKSLRVPETRVVWNSYAPTKNDRCKKISEYSPTIQRVRLVHLFSSLSDSERKFTVGFMPVHFHNSYSLSVRQQSEPERIVPKSPRLSPAEFVFISSVEMFPIFYCDIIIEQNEFFQKLYRGV